MRATAPAMKASDVFDYFTTRFKDLAYEFHKLIDGVFAAMTIGETVSAAAGIIDDDVSSGTAPVFDTIDEYAEITFETPFFMKYIRHYGDASCNLDGRARLQALVDGAWVNALIDIESRAASWSAWLEVTTKYVATNWRFTLTIVDTGTDKSFHEIELRGVTLG